MNSNSSNNINSNYDYYFFQKRKYGSHNDLDKGELYHLRRPVDRSLDGVLSS